MQRIVIILILLIGVCKLHAQEYIIDLPKQKKNDFANNLVKLLNATPDFFKDYKDKPLKQIDSAYLGITVLQNKLHLKGASAAKIVLDSIPFAEYYFGKFSTKEEAEASYVNLTNQIAEALSRKVLFKSEEGKGTSSLVKQTKIAFTQNSGFFLFNMNVQLHRNLIDSSLHLLLKVKGGKPPYFYKIMKNEPVNSFMFVGSLKSMLNGFQSHGYQGCMGSLSPFVCTKERRSKDSVYVIYTKAGMQDLPDAKKEFETALTNMRVCMSEDYVYYLLPPTGTHLREVVFLRFEDVEKVKPKTLHLAMVKENEYSYKLEMSFVYK